MNTRLSLPETRAASGDGPGGGPRVALALGGGGARGIAHIAVIEALDEMGIRPVALGYSREQESRADQAGLSYLETAGMSGAEIRAFTLETLGNRGTVLNRLWSLGPDAMRDMVGGFRLGHFNLERILTAFLPVQVPARFEDLAIPLKVAVTDYYGQAEAILEEGELSSALAASAAIPGLFMPVRIHGRIMVDGGIFNPIPYEHVADGADIVIGVDVVGGPEGDGTHAPNRIESMFGASQLMMQACIALKLKLHPPHLFLRPPVSRFGVMDFLKVRDILAETEGVKDELKRGLESLIEASARA